MKKFLKILLISLMMIVIVLMFNKKVLGYAHSSHSSHSVHSSHSTPHSTTSHSTPKTTTKSSTSSSKSKTITGYKSGTGKTYTKPKTYTSKYNSSNIKTEITNTNPTKYSSYSSTNIFRPNFWTAMWAFKCMENNNKEVTEQDIVKELEERGYNEEEIQEILKEGEEAKQAEKEEKDKNNKICTKLLIIFGIIALAIIVIFLLAAIFGGF